MSIVAVPGCGVMATALSVPLTDNGHEARLTGTHLGRAIIEEIREDRAAGPAGPRLPAEERDVCRGHGRVRGERDDSVVAGGTLIAAGRVTAGRPSCSGKHKRHGMSPRVIAGPCGEILWVSGALPGAVHDERAGWIWGVLDELEATGLIVLAGKGYQGAAHARVPYRGKNEPRSREDAGKAHAKPRAPGERANTQLKTWKVLRGLRCCPWKARQIAMAIHVLQTREA